MLSAATNDFVRRIIKKLLRVICVWWKGDSENFWFWQTLEPVVRADILLQLLFVMYIVHHHGRHGDVSAMTYDYNDDYDDDDDYWSVTITK